MTDDRASHLPRPFHDEWPRRLQPAAHALWAWHTGLAEPQPRRRDDLDASQDVFFEEERERVDRGDPIRLLPEAVCSEAYAVCEEHDLDRSLLGAQVTGARILSGETRFETTDALKEFVRLWAVPHGRLLAGLAGADYSTQLRSADELARGFFHLGRLATLPRDVRQDRLFLPLDELRQAGVTVEQLQQGRVDESIRRLLWKHSVRIRDALVQGRSLINDLSFRQGYALKWYWMGARALLTELDRRDYDLWSRPLDLGFFRRGQVYVQTFFGRTGL